MCWQIIMMMSMICNFYVPVKELFNTIIASSRRWRRKSVQNYFLYSTEKSFLSDPFGPENRYLLIVNIKVIGALAFITCFHAPTNQIWNTSKSKNENTIQMCACWQNFVAVEISNANWSPYHIYLSWNIISSTINISYFFVVSTSSSRNTSGPKKKVTVKKKGWWQIW